MTWLPDAALARLRRMMESPDFSGTKYEIVEKVGEGGMAAVYVAYDRELDRRVAVKILHDTTADPEFQHRLQLEARTIARLEHPGILPVHDIGVLADGRIYYAMKLVRGRRLDEFIDSATSLPDRLRLFLRICDAVAFAHAQGVIHRDLKPSNIMIGDFGEVLVIDWGLAKIIRDAAATGESDAHHPIASAGTAGTAATDGSKSTVHGAILGTPGYMAPEQEDGRVDSIDARTDVYGLGGLLRFVLRDDAPKPIRAVAAKAQAPAAADRYGTAGEVARDVSCFLDGERVSAYAEGPWEAGRRLLARHRTVVVLIATYLAVRVILLLVR